MKASSQSTRALRGLSGGLACEFCNSEEHAESDGHAEQGPGLEHKCISPLHREPNVRVSTGRAGLHAEERACDARGASQTLGDGREKTGDVVQLGRHSNRILGLDGWPMPST